MHFFVVRSHLDAAITLLHLPLGASVHGLTKRRALSLIKQQQTWHIRTCVCKHRDRLSSGTRLYNLDHIRSVPSSLVDGCGRSWLVRSVSDSPFELRTVPHRSETRWLSLNTQATLRNTVQGTKVEFQSSRNPSGQTSRGLKQPEFYNEQTFDGSFVPYVPFRHWIIPHPLLSC